MGSKSVMPTTSLPLAFTYSRSVSANAALQSSIIAAITRAKAFVNFFIIFPSLFLVCLFHAFSLLLYSDETIA